MWSVSRHLNVHEFTWLHRFWWRMLETKCVGDNYKILVTVLVTNFNISTSRCHQHHCHRLLTFIVTKNLKWFNLKNHPLAGFCPLNVLTEGDDPEESSPLCSFTSGCPICILPLIVFDGPIIPALPLFSWFLNHKWWSTTYQFRMKVITWCKIKIHKLKINATSHNFSEHWFQRAVHVRERFGLDQIIRINY